MNRKIIALLISALPLFVNAQTRIEYEYDAAGYRISQYFIFDDMLQRRPSKSLPSDKLDGHSVKIVKDAGQNNLFIEIFGLVTDDDCRLSILSVDGQPTVHQQISSTRTVIDFGEYPSRTYILTIELNGKKQSWKFIKK